MGGIKYEKLIVPTKWDKHVWFNEGVAIVWEGETWYIIDMTGSVIF